MFSHIPSHLRDAAVPDWSGYREPKWLWRVTNSSGTLSLGVSIMSYHDLPVDGRNASIFGWLLRRGEAWHLSRPRKGCSSCDCLLPGLTWCWSAQLGLSVPSGSSQFTSRDRVQLALPETLQVFPKICSSRGWESDRLYYRESVCPFLRISYISGSNKTIKSKTIHKELDN